MTSRILAVAAALLWLIGPALAQTPVVPYIGPSPVSNSNPIPVSGSFSATTTGFAPSLSYATCTAAGTACASTALPTNTGSVVLFNSGTTTVSCTLASGAATATTNQLQIPASSGLPVAATYGATTYDHFSCIDQSGSTSNLVIASGGSGLPTGWGGGGGGSGGTVNQGTPGASPWLVTLNGSDTTQSGTIALAGAANAILVTTSGRSTVGLDVSGTWSGSLLVAGSVDYAIVGAGSAHWGVTTSVTVTNGAIVNAITANGQYQINAAGFSAVRVYAASLVSGSAVIGFVANSGVASVMADNPLPVQPLYTGTAYTTWPGDATNGGYIQAKSGTFVDGAIATLGTLGDAAWTGSGNGTSNAILKGIYTSVNGAIAAGTNIIGKVGIDQTTPGTTNNVAVSYGSVALVDNPCETVAKSYTPISITTATTTRIIAPTAAKKTYVCSISIQAAAADNVGVVEGTGGTCGTGTAGVYGGTTAASGLNLAANEGIALGSGLAPIMATAGTNVDFCLITSAATNLAGHVTWVQK